MKKRIAIMYGGPSKEHEVSTNSAKNVLSFVDREKYDVVELYLPKERKSFETLVEELKNEKIDVVLPILHGAFGEDGVLQEILEDAHINFVGSGSEASRNAMNKEKANELFKKSGLTVPKTQIVDTHSEIEINFPIIMKPIDEGSSVGLFKFNSLKEYDEGKEKVFASYKNMMAQECILGREFTCGVVELDGQDIALPITEVILNPNDLFDYSTKYTAGACNEITPAVINEYLSNRLKEIALKCHEVLGCKSISRTDMIATLSGEIFILETNTLPGMTKTSFIPAQISVYGLEMKDFLSKLIESAK